MLDGKLKLRTHWLVYDYYWCNYHIHDYRIMTIEYYSTEESYHLGFCLECVVNLKMF